MLKMLKYLLSQPWCPDLGAEFLFDVEVERGRTLSQTGNFFDKRRSLSSNANRKFCWTISSFHAKSSQHSTHLRPHLLPLRFRLT